ncbi:hypothetical protein CXF72_17165 [Psychromonas sp. MB-3u-54]|uniref:hypothetical protein n=1 Tax=Psychromonas sp. MB-3u-54 TaxID=2058319 RepID=UPI000C32F35D|nr:hypothetical protein [Psychromonas sp. MB-3u-54]PKH01400.1 hypothetical protein CXF72_17165 [Psychromonas sp. MB-3u-54]
MKKIISALGLIYLSACTIQPVAQSPVNSEESQCIGSVELNPQVAELFAVADDLQMLQRALGEPELGKLCQGKVYQLKQGQTLPLYRSWNSTNPNSQMGSWWAFNKPTGKVSLYRNDYEICYQWSPLDKLTQCQLKAGAKVVIGNGQSAQCSDYLSYPVSAVQQVYIENSSELMQGCEQFDAVFKWQPDVIESKLRFK